MFKGISRVLVIAMMLVAFVGQAITFNTSVSCETLDDAISHNNSELVKHYDSIPIEIDSSEDCCGIECCDLDCTCIANACSSFIYAYTEVDSTKRATLTEVVYLQLSEHPLSISSFLYRPPISAS